MAMGMELVSSNGLPDLLFTLSSTQTLDTASTAVSTTYGVAEQANIIAIKGQR